MNQSSHINAALQARREAAARDERRLYAVACKRLLAREARAPWPHPPAPRRPLVTLPRARQPQEAPFKSDLVRL
jgi:hypothetical protein